MTVFSYKVMERSGRLVTGSLDAASLADATRSLAGSGNTVLELTSGGPKAANVTPSTVGSRFTFGKSVDHTQLFADLALLTGAGLTVSQALETVSKSGSPVKQAQSAKLVLEAISSGSAPSVAFRQLDGISEASLALILSGENSGGLHKVFTAISKQLSQQSKDRSALINSMAYPLFLILLMILAFSIVTFVLVPALEPAFENTGKLPPLAIRIFSSIRSVFTTGLPVLVSVLSLIAVTFAFGKTRKYLAGAILSLFAKAPLIGKQIRDQHTAAYLASLSLLLENGVTLSRSLELANAAVTQPLLHEKFESVRKLVTGGARLPDAFAKLNIFDDRIVSILSVGYEAGKLPFATGQSAIMLEERARKRMDLFLAILTPAITIFIGAAIGGLILSVMSALLSVNELAIQ